MTRADVIDELAKISRGITAGSPIPIPDPTRRLVDACIAIEELRGRLIEELRGSSLPADASLDVWDRFDCPWPPPEAGSWRDRPPML